MITKDLSTLKIHKLTQEQYDRELAADNLDETAIYLTPDEEINLSQYATVEQLNNKADKTEIDTIVEELKTQLDEKINAEHTHDDLYYTISQIDGMEFISTDDIDTICGGVTEEGLPSSDIDQLMAQLR